MTRFFLIGGIVLFIGLPSHSQSLPSFSNELERRAVVDQYCGGCHSGKSPAAGLAIKRLDYAQPANSAVQFEKVIRKLRAGMMPPAGLPRPKPELLNRFVQSLETSIDHVETVHPNPGRPALHRLNRTEYRNSVRDLLNVDVDVASLLPADDSSGGFDNQAGVLNVSPTLIDAYIRAAGKISRQALGDSRAAPLVETYHVPANFSQTRHVDGAPLGTRGGLVVDHNFPADGTYSFKVSLYFTTNTFVFGTYQKDEQIEVSVNGRRVALLKFNPRMKTDEELRTPPVKIKAGPQTVSVAFLAMAEGPVDDFVQPIGRSLGDLFAGQIQGLTALPHVRDVGINGPYNVTGISATPSRSRLLVCAPRNAKDELPCARRIIAPLARHAYRRPVHERDLKNLLSLYQEGRNRGDFESGIRLALQGVLADPQFVFRFERAPPHVLPGSNYRVSDLELASRLSYFLWSSAPDNQLLTLAAQGKLRQPGVLERQVRRMLADPKSEALAANFAGQWLYLRNLQDAQPDVFAYPNTNDNLLNSMRRETELFFGSIIHENRSILDLLDADYTFVNEDLADLYGIPDVEGERFRRVSITDDNRRGLLGQASILTVTSVANRTSPVIRGKWIMENLLGAPPPPPPPNVPSLKEGVNSGKMLTVRERLEEHRSNPACAACHRMIDPIGFSLENFDGVGAWRIHDGMTSIDSKGKLTDGTEVSSPAGLRHALLQHSDAFVRTFTEKLLTYALGRSLEFYDMPVVRAVDRQAAQNQNRFESFVLAAVKSAPFQMRQADSKSSSSPNTLVTARRENKVD